jgi:hypothetical protein
VLLPVALCSDCDLGTTDSLALPNLGLQGLLTGVEPRYM